MKMMNPSKSVALASLLLGMTMSASVLAQEAVAPSLSDEVVDAGDGVAEMVFDFVGNGQSQGFQCDIEYDSTGIADIDLSECLGGQFGTCVFPAGGDHTGGVIRIAVADIASQPLGDFSGVIEVTLDGSLADGDSIAFTWGGAECIATDPDAPVDTTDGSVTVQEVVGECSLSIDPTSHNFGNVAAGDVDHHTFIVTNTGTDVCGNLMADAGPDPFGVDPVADDCSGAILAVGESCEVDVAFGPTGDGDFDGQLDVTADGAEVSAALSGNSGDEPPPPPAIGVPTLQAWGLALMALLMLTIGVFSVRTFRS